MWPRRGLNRIAWAGGALTLVGFTPTYGEHPRNFGIHPSGRWLVVANQNTDNIVRATPLHHSQHSHSHTPHTATAAVTAANTWDSEPVSPTGRRGR